MNYFMKTLYYCALIISFYFICLCYANNYNYTMHKTYIYKFKKNNNIDFVDTYGCHIIMNVDDSTYNECSKNRKCYYLIKKYDNGKKYIIKKI